MYIAVVNIYKIEKKFIRKKKKFLCNDLYKIDVDNEEMAKKIIEKICCNMNEVYKLSYYECNLIKRYEKMKVYRENILENIPEYIYLT
ncbi:hypothetical protein [Clostridium akagii]|uniref:hypothetical protein n=1 Tax=Clostridium akagii TaxID=91623 RepID=UPI00047C1BEE|nr:hypothetical protein [Clostridium akagii]